MKIKKTEILISLSVVFIMGCENKVFKEYYENGNLKKTYYKNGDVLHGLAIYYDSLGNKIQEQNWTNGELNGLCVGYFTNGRIKDSINFVNGKKNGKYVKYDSNGKLNETSYYIDDLGNGDLTGYYPSGSIRAQATLRNDTLVGKQYQYFESGNIEAYLYYKNGDVIYEKFYDENQDVVGHNLPFLIDLNKKKLKIALGHSIYEKPMLGLILGKVDTIKMNVIDTLQLKSVEGLELSIELPSDMDDIIEGIIYEIDSETKQYDVSLYFSLPVER